jgi:sn-glycerol 3-phosphate transport system substrate-binding protein
MRRATRLTQLRALGGLAAVALVAACSGGGSITGGSPTTASSTPSSGSTADTASVSTLPATTSTVADTLPECPADALASASGPVTITFWHGMSGPLNDEMIKLTDAYNASQTKVKVKLVQASYETTTDNYLQAKQSDRPDMVQLPEYTVQSIIDTKSTVSIDKCITTAKYDTSKFLQTALDAYASGGVQRAMPFNISNPVLFYNKQAFTKAGLDPNKPPASLDELQAMSKKIVDSGASTYGLALDTGFDSGGGWYIEQWFAKARKFYLDGDNGRTSRATKVLYNDQTGVDLMTFLQKMLNDKLAVNVGDNNATGYDNLLKLADQKAPAAMTINTSAALGPVLSVLGGGQFPNIKPDDVGIGPMPGPDGKPGALIGGAALWVVNSGDPARIAATWDYLTYLESAQTQSTWAVATGYVPTRSDAFDVDPYKTTVAKDPRFAVAYQQLKDTPAGPTSVGPLTGPLREVRTVLATAVAAIFGGADPKASLDGAAQQADDLITQYTARN